MKKSLIKAVGTFSVFALFASSVQLFALNIGDKMPMLPTMKNIDGKDLNQKDFQGKAGTLVIFSCNHCPYVKAWEERMVKIGNDYKAKGFGVVAINSNDTQIQPEDGYEEMVKRAKDRGMKYPYVVDPTSKVATAFGATKTPEAFLFDTNGKLIYHGAIDDNSEDAKEVKKTFLKDALEAALAKKPVAVAESKAIGCGIKFRK